LAQRQQRRIAATSAALPGSTKAPLHLFATHIVDRHHVIDTRDILSAVAARTSGFLSSPHFGGSTCGHTVPDPITKAANYHGLAASNQNASADAG
jgi:hypothetical protein